MKKDPSAVKRDKESVIFGAALKVIKQKGFHKARMSDIAKEAGISYGLVYHYFNNKEDLFDAILNRWWDGLFGLMKGISEGDNDVHKKLRQIIDYFLDTYQSEPELVNIFITEISRSTTNLTSYRLDHFKKSMSLTEEIIAEGQKKQLLRTDIKARYLTYMFLGSVETFLSTMVLVDQKIKGDTQKERIAQSILEVFLNGARNQKNL
ncbi:MAG: TetR/AcrR family transcriptional regulator [Deltaproteobacteria bacterium]|nr:TetR/AcrR family transcriptional regulator [Deltaproteobacteria bacterium]MBW1909438.1 TetR/AcrR family transcriptional regulator [Deltaproteobacteria bacterium]MBW2032733.1 TetR/AcrR family transcriptional regulator [Deltaproteobacteria bacterium]